MIKDKLRTLADRIQEMREREREAAAREIAAWLRSLASDKGSVVVDTVASGFCETLAEQLEERFGGKPNA